MIRSQLHLVPHVRGPVREVVSGIRDMRWALWALWAHALLDLHVLGLAQKIGHTLGPLKRAWRGQRAGCRVPKVEGLAVWELWKACRAHQVPCPVPEVLPSLQTLWAEVLGADVATADAAQSTQPTGLPGKLWDTAGCFDWGWGHAAFLSLERLGHPFARAIRQVDLHVPGACLPGDYAAHGEHAHRGNGSSNRKGHVGRGGCLGEGNRQVGSRESPATFSCKAIDGIGFRVFPSHRTGRPSLTGTRLEGPQWPTTLKSLKHPTCFQNHLPSPWGQA